MKTLSKDQLETLRAIDTPTICNAIERFKVRDETTGFTGMHIHSLFPQLGTTVGYALTVTVDSTTPAVVRDNAGWIDWVRKMESAPKPIFLVFQDIGPKPEKSAHMGEVMASLAKRMGAVGLVTNGGVRDVVEVERLGFQYFAAGIVPAHGNPRLLQVNVPVVIDGVEIEPGDLLHGDVNGVFNIPWEIASRTAEMALKIRQEESDLLEYINGADFTVDGFLKRKFTH
jgi:4-hydroxy-4-methyl-2-oxoglutarate aldolase